MWLLLFDDGNDAGKADLKAEMVYPDWYERRVVRGERRGRWTVKRDLYDWWLRKIETEIHVGHRFYGIMTLAIFRMTG